MCCLLKNTLGFEYTLVGVVAYICCCVASLSVIIFHPFQRDIFLAAQWNVNLNTFINEAWQWLLHSEMEQFLIYSFCLLKGIQMEECQMDQQYLGYLPSEVADIYFPRIIFQIVSTFSLKNLYL